MSDGASTHDPCGQGLERSCERDWLCSAADGAGVHRIAAFFSGEAYAPHRHDTYSIGYTLAGVQRFTYRGSRKDSTAGRAIVLHPDELHDGEAGSDEGFRYHMVYIEPRLIQDALPRGATALPFVDSALQDDARLINAVETFCSDMQSPLEPLAVDGLVSEIAYALDDLSDADVKAKSDTVDRPAVERACAYLRANYQRVVRSDELEQVAQHDRYTLARYFRLLLGTSPYRYATMRRLEHVKGEIASGCTLADASADAGFSDQAHMSRQFSKAFGISPGRWRRLHAEGGLRVS